MTGDARAVEREPRQGRHRRGSAGTSWTPEIPPARRFASHTRPDDAPPEFPAWDEDTVPRMVVPATRPDEDPADRGPAEPEPREDGGQPGRAWPETAPTGLRKFDLGTIPASVTPPRTWRRAALFAVGTATFVVVGLGYAAFTFVAGPNRSTTIEALPGQPNQQLMITGLPGDLVTSATPRPTSATSATPTSATPTSSTAPATRPTDMARPTLTGDRSPPGDPAPYRPGEPTSTGKPDAPGPKPKPKPTRNAPPRNTVQSALLALTDADALGDRTEQYFAHVVGDPAAAYALTSGRMRAEGPEGIKARYADVKRVEVRRITIDPHCSCTRNTLVVVHKNGSITTVKRELTFSSGTNPKITGDSEPA